MSFSKRRAIDLVSSANYLKTNTAISRFYHKNSKDLPVQLLRMQACRDLKSRIYLISLNF